ncbi:MAG: hypothetical protein KBS94_00810, partial [Prevotella sp.]|nr:hypothetical protein [Candidatus Equicola faecalis]
MKSERLKPDSHQWEFGFPSKGSCVTIVGVPYNHRRDAIDGIRKDPRQHRKTPKTASENPFDWNRCSATLDDG